jgi:hypothetical protein
MPLPIEAACMSCMVTKAIAATTQPTNVSTPKIIIAALGPVRRQRYLQDLNALENHVEREHVRQDLQHPSHSPSPYGSRCQAQSG